MHPDDLKSNKLISTESVNTSQNRPLWKLLVALRKPDDDEDEEEEDDYEDDDNDEEDDDDDVVMIHWLCVVGFVVDYISHPVINSFTTAAAMTIACSQLKVVLLLLLVGILYILLITGIANSLVCQCS